MRWGGWEGTQAISRDRSRKQASIKVNNSFGAVPLEAQPVRRLRQIEQRILLLCGQRVILDADLAPLYGATTKHLNQQVKRNRARFPLDFMFQLSPKKKVKVVWF